MQKLVLFLSFALIAIACDDKEISPRRSAVGSPYPSPVPGATATPARPQASAAPGSPSSAGGSTGNRSGTGVTPAWPGPVASDCIESTPEVCAGEQQILIHTNEIRARYGKPALTLDPKISYVARAWSKSQALMYGMGHTGFPSMRVTTYRNFFREEPSIGMYAENVAQNWLQRGGDYKQLAYEFVVDQWKDSPGHLSNMLGKYKYLGAGIFVSATGKAYGTQIFGN